MEPRLSTTQRSVDCIPFRKMLTEEDDRTKRCNFFCAIHSLFVRRLMFSLNTNDLCSQICKQTEVKGQIRLRLEIATSLKSLWRVLRTCLVCLSNLAFMPFWMLFLPCRFKGVAGKSFTAVRSFKLTNKAKDKQVRVARAAGFVCAVRC